MDAETQKKYLNVLDKAIADGEYQLLYEAYGVHTARLEILLKQLPPEQAEVIYDYIDLCAPRSDILISILFRHADPPVDQPRGGDQRLGYGSFLLVRQSR